MLLLRVVPVSRRQITEGELGRCLGRIANPVAPEMWVRFNYDAFLQINRVWENGNPCVLDTQEASSILATLTNLKLCRQQLR